ncbi:MAG: fumarate hydratase [Candidatus Methanophagaceae archaeon]|nr:MAG: fumarate hydratase [Methanophagales archaeon]
MNEDDVARSGQLALLLEVSAYPKPGNVSRTHDFAETSYEHFLASAVAVYPVLREAAARGFAWKGGGGVGVGELVRRAVEESVAWQSGGNTHFGALLLLVPLAVAAGSYKPDLDPGLLKRRAEEVVQNTSVEDAVELYRAFPKAKVKVRAGVPEFDLTDAGGVREIRASGKSLHEILEISASYDLISRELVGGFEKTFRYAELLKDWIKNKDKERRVNDAVTNAYLRLLSEERDTFVEMKFGAEKSESVRRRAEEIVNSGCKRGEVEEFDEELIKEGVNPGSTADIIAAALFVALLGGLRV